MANIITAGNSTNGGTAISTDTSGTLNIVTGSGSGANAITIDASQNVAMTAGQTIAGNLTVTGSITGGSISVANSLKAWVNFNGQGTIAIRASNNVSSITDGGAGVYAINFTTAMQDANYVVHIAASVAYSSLNIFSPAVATGVGAVEVAPTTTSCSTYIATSNTTPFDPKYVNVVVFR
jgi:hypothetical protein